MCDKVSGVCAELYRVKARFDDALRRVAVITYHAFNVLDRHLSGRLVSVTGENGGGRDTCQAIFTAAAISSLMKQLSHDLAAFLVNCGGKSLHARNEAVVIQLHYTLAGI